MNFLKLALVILSAGGVAAAVTVPQYINSIHIGHKDEMISFLSEQAKSNKETNKHNTEGIVSLTKMWEQGEVLRRSNREYKDNDPTILRRGCRIIKDKPDSKYEYMSICEKTTLKDAQERNHKVAFISIIAEKGSEFETYLKSAHAKIGNEAYDPEKHGIFEW